MMITEGGLAAGSIGSRIVPDLQGKGLAKPFKPLLSAVCTRLRELNFTRACLVTETARIPAINLCLKFGFVPEIERAGDSGHTAWEIMRPA